MKNTVYNRNADKTSKIGFTDLSKTKNIEIGFVDLNKTKLNLKQ